MNPGVVGTKTFEQDCARVEVRSVNFCVCACARTCVYTHTEHFMGLEPRSLEGGFPLESTSLLGQIFLKRFHVAPFCGIQVEQIGWGCISGPAVMLHWITVSFYAAFQLGQPQGCTCKLKAQNKTIKHQLTNKTYRERGKTIVSPDNILEKQKQDEIRGLARNEHKLSS